MNRLIYPLLWLMMGHMVTPCNAQTDRVLIHSHNDYEQEAPFYGAYARQVFSIEADVFAMEDGRLLVGHHRSDLTDNRTLEQLYITPIVSSFEANGGRAWRDSDHRFVLLIDLKTPAPSTLPNIVQLVGAYPAVFDSRVNPLAVQVVISGDMPSPSAFNDYPPFILFDGRVTTDYTPAQLDRIAFFSGNFRDFSQWTGDELLSSADKERLEEVVQAAHTKGKQVRFWATPDGEKSWKALQKLGVDIINTDRIDACVDYFNAVKSEKKEGAVRQSFEKKVPVMVAR
ncbi:MAG TPA: hypothetical protein VNQ55_03595 [Parapedobacter sp.]|nr:hypothetical protein [Parapedobacter sp.]